MLSANASMGLLKTNAGFARKAGGRRVSHTPDLSLVI